MLDQYPTIRLSLKIHCIILKCISFETGLEFFKISRLSIIMPDNILTPWRKLH